MAGSVNKVILVGRAGRDPEIRHTQAGDKIAQLSLATSETWRDKATGERKEKTEWHRVSCMNPGLSDVIERYVKKGSLVYVEGALQTRRWQDQSGADRYSTEVVLSKFRGALTLLSDRDRTESGGAGQGGGGGQANSAADRPAWGGDLDDEIPF